MKTIFSIIALGIFLTMPISAKAAPSIEDTTSDFLTATIHDYDKRLVFQEIDMIYTGEIEDFRQIFYHAKTTLVTKKYLIKFRPVILENRIDFNTPDLRIISNTTSIQDGTITLAIKASNDDVISNTVFIDVPVQKGLGVANFSLNFSESNGPVELGDLTFKIEAVKSPIKENDTLNYHRINIHF